MAFSTLFFPHSLLISIFSTKINAEEPYSGYFYLNILVTGISRICLSLIASKGRFLIIGLNSVQWNSAVCSQLGWVGKRD